MNNFKELTDQIYLLYKSFIESGFTDYQAYELTEEYTRLSIFDSIFASKKRSKQELYRDYLYLTSERRKKYESNNED